MLQKNLAEKAKENCLNELKFYGQFLIEEWDVKDE